MHAAHSTPSVRRAARGAWPLEAGRALKLRPREDAFLRAGHGRVWVTFDRVPQGPANASGDHFLHAGERIAVKAGQAVVVSASGPRGAHASFDWEPMPAPARKSTAVVAWRHALLQAWAGLGLSLAAAP